MTTSPTTALAAAALVSPFLTAAGDRVWSCVLTVDGVHTRADFTDVGTSVEIDVNGDIVAIVDHETAASRWLNARAAGFRAVW